MTQRGKFAAFTPEWWVAPQCRSGQGAHHGQQLRQRLLAHCNGVIAWSIYRWDLNRKGRRVRRGVRFVCDFHAASIPEDPGSCPDSPASQGRPAPSMSVINGDPF